MPLNVGLSSCGSLCQHPACWAAIRKQEKGIKSLPPLDSSSDDSDSELDLPTQSVCNLLSDLGEDPNDRYPLSTGGRPSHQWESPVHSGSVKSKHGPSSVKKLDVPNNTKASLFSKAKSTGIPRQRRCLPQLEVQEVFDFADLNSQWDETFVTKQYYIWVANPKKRKRKGHGEPLTSRSDPNAPVLVKDMTELMVPSEIEQQREDTVLFDEWPVLKKRQPRTASPPSKPIQFKKPLPVQSTLPEPPSNIDMEGINELLALPKDVLMRVLEQTKRSDFSSKGKLHNIVKECVQDDEAARLLLSTRELLKQKKMDIHKIPKGDVRKSQPTPPKPVFQLDDETLIERMSSANTPVRDKAVCSEVSSVESFPRYTRPLPKIKGDCTTYHLSGPGQLFETQDVRKGPLKAKLPSISLGLPELPSGVRTTKAFAYNSNNMVDFTLGPMISPPSTQRSSVSGDYSEHGTTIKVNVPLSGLGYMDVLRDNDMAIHSVSPALSTHVPFAPAGTPATFMSPTKSAPNLRDISRDPTQVTINLSLMAQPSSKDLRETTLLSSPGDTSGHFAIPIPTASPAIDPALAETPDDKGLDTIKETAREAGGEGSVASSSHVTLGDKRDDPPRLILQTSSLTNIRAAVSPIPKSARSIESCPSPEQWPLISESSFEKMIPRSSISEPALSGRSGRRALHRGHDENGKGVERDYARKVMDEKLTAESPAPPPPSPEPKDRDEYRARKDLKSRESLSMAPLFEVNEMEEMEDDRLEKDGRRKQVRKIHAVIPQAKIDDDKKMESEESEEVMVSQITVTHVAPKGIQGHNGQNETREKVQETFLNVDIPAEEIGSCKAEHGSSRREDISSTNDSGAKSEVTTTDSQVSGLTTVNQKETKEEQVDRDDDDEDDNNEDENNDNDEDDTLDPPPTDRQLSLDERQYLEMQRDRTDSARLNSEDSGASPELVCDSARFMSHDLVSPMEGDINGRDLQMMALLREVTGTCEDDDEGVENEEGELDRRIIIGEQEDDDEGVENEEGELDRRIIIGEQEDDDQGKEEDVGDKEVEDVNMEVSREGTKENDLAFDESGEERKESASSKETGQSEDIEPPGSFFFQQDGASTYRSLDDNGNEEKKTTETEETAGVNQVEVEGEKRESAIVDNAQDVDVTIKNEESELNEDKNDGKEKTEDDTDVKESSSVPEETKGEFEKESENEVEKSETKEEIVLDININSLVSDNQEKSDGGHVEDDLEGKHSDIKTEEEIPPKDGEQQTSQDQNNNFTEETAVDADDRNKSTDGKEEVEGQEKDEK